MSIPNRPGSRAENLYGNMIGQETATPPEQPQSRIEEYLDYILKNGTEAEQQIIEDVEALKGIGRYLSMWNGATGLPTTNPKKTPYKYKAGDYYIVSNIGATNYMPSGTQYDGTASTTIDADAKVNDYYIFDGTTWSRLDHSTVESVFVATYTQGANNAWSCDKTYSEIKAAYNAGKICLGLVTTVDGKIIIYLNNTGSSNIIWFSNYVAGDLHGRIQHSRCVVHNSDDSIVVTQTSSTVLPAVNSSDNGKILGVSNGVWDKIDPPQDAFVATYTYANSTWSCDKTFAEIKAAYDAGKFCLARANGYANATQYRMLSCDSSAACWVSCNNAFLIGYVQSYSIAHFSSGSIENSTTNSPTLPSVSSSDNGKVLGVSNGAWNKVDPPTELPSVTSSDNGSELKVINGAWAKRNIEELSVNYYTGHTNTIEGRTYEEIASLLSSGAEVVINIRGDYSGSNIPRRDGFYFRGIVRHLVSGITSIDTIYIEEGDFISDIADTEHYANVRIFETLRGSNEYTVTPVIDNGNIIGVNYGDEPVRLTGVLFSGAIPKIILNVQDSHFAGRINLEFVGIAGNSAVFYSRMLDFVDVRRALVSNYGFAISDDAVSASLYVYYDEQNDRDVYVWSSSSLGRLDQIDLITEYPALNALLFGMFQQGLTAALTGGGSADIQVSDYSGDNISSTVDSFLSYIFNNVRNLEHTLDGIVLDGGNATRFLCRKINVANGISCHANFHYTIQSVFEGIIDVIFSINGVPSAGSISNRSVVMSIKATPISGMNHYTAS